MSPLVAIAAALLQAEPPPPAAAPSARAAWTEAEAIAAFEAGNPALVDARAAEAAARAGVVQAGLRPNPSLSGGASNFPLRPNPPPAGNGAAFGRNLVWSVELDQPFELGGKRGKRLAQANAALASATASTLDTHRSALFDLRRAFWQAVRTRERRALAEQVTLRSGETVRIAQARFQGQDISRVDLEKVELEAMRQQNALADAVAAERSAISVLLVAAGPTAPAVSQVVGDLALPRASIDAARLFAKAEARRPDLAAARAEAEEARAALAVAQAAAVPDVTVGLGYTRSAAVAVGDNPESGGVTLSLPLPLFARNQGEIQRARIEVARSDRAVEALRAAIRQEVAAAAALYAAAAEKVERYEGGVLQRADRALQIAVVTWREGARSLLEFLEAERTWIELRGDYLDTLFELRDAALQLERAVAGPIVEDAS